MFRHFYKNPISTSLANRTSRYFSKVEKVESLAIEPKNELFSTYLKEEFTNLYATGYQQKVPGHATTKGTKYYSLRKDTVDPGNFKKSIHDDLTISSVGIGTYIGSPDEVDDIKMFNGIIESVQTGGVNVIDTAINYRYQKSERVVGAALRYLIQQGYVRDEFFISSKNGYVPEDADKGISNDVAIKPLIEKGKVPEEEVIKDISNNFVHCLHPAFLEDQLDRTLANIGIETLDLYYLHNAAESQLPKIGEQTFDDRLSRAFEFCENQVQKGKIRSYGLATWSCFRAKPKENDTYLALQNVVELAKKVGGDNHKFRYVQLPLNILMPEAFLERWQIYKDGEKESRETLFQAAKSLNINIVTSSPLAQGLMMQVPLSFDTFKATNLGAKHLQFARSAPAQALLTTVVGQKTARHVKKNLEVIQYPRLTDEEWAIFFKPSKRKAEPEEAVEMED